VLRSIQKLPKNFEGIEMPKPDFWVLLFNISKHLKTHTRTNTHTHTHKYTRTHARKKTQARGSAPTLQNLSSTYTLTYSYAYTLGLFLSHTHIHTCLHVCTHLQNPHAVETQYCSVFNPPRIHTQTYLSTCICAFSLSFKPWRTTLCQYTHTHIHTYWQHNLIFSFWY